MKKDTIVTIPVSLAVCFASSAMVGVGFILSDAWEAKGAPPAQQDVPVASVSGPSAPVAVPVPAESKPSHRVVMETMQGIAVWFFNQSAQELRAIEAFVHPDEFIDGQVPDGYPLRTASEALEDLGDGWYVLHSHVRVDSGGMKNVMLGFSLRAKVGPDGEALEFGGLDNVTTDVSQNRVAAIRQGFPR